MAADSNHRPSASSPPAFPAPDHIKTDEGLRPRGPDRRKAAGASPTGLERRRGPGRRLSDFMRAAEEGQLTQEQFLFVMAVDAFKTANGVTYPSWTDVLEVVRLLGYRKTLPSSLKINAAEDFTEAADAPAKVRRSEDRRAA
jgi:hypothetical protein